MAYIGKNLVGILKEQKTVDTMTGDGSDTTLTLSDTPGSVNNVLVFFDGIRQTPITDYTLMGTTLTFTTAPEASVNVVAISGNWSGVVPKMGSVTSSKIVDGMVMDAHIVTGVASSKLTGALPAISGANLTGIVSDTGITSNASDPTISTNPAGGLGTVWANSTSGEMFVLTDATAGSNVWTNVGSGTGDVAKAFGGNGPGTIAGFASGGFGSPTYYNIIDKYTFGSSANATDHGDLTTIKRAVTGHSSATEGFTSGSNNATAPNYHNTIDKFTFASTGNATDHGDLSAGRAYGAGSSSYTDGYHAGGYVDTTLIEKFAFSSNVTATSHGNLQSARYDGTGCSSDTHGFSVAGYETSIPAAIPTIDKFAYSSNVTATDHGDLSVSRNQLASHSSTTHGYGSGGSGNQDVIDKFAFSSNTTATDHGNLSVGRTAPSGTSSTTHGYSAGGGGTSNVIDKFAYSSNTTATDHGDLTVGRERAGSEGQQY